MRLQLCRKRTILAVLVTFVLILFLWFEACLLWNHSLLVPKDHQTPLLHGTTFEDSSKQRQQQAQSTPLRATEVERMEGTHKNLYNNINISTRTNIEAACRYGPRTSHLIRPKYLSNWTRENVTFLPCYDKTVQPWGDDDRMKRQHEYIQEAGCEVNVPLELVNHFPHVMQNLYSCWSFWQYRIHQQQTNSTQVHPVLYIPHELDNLVIDIENIQAWSKKPPNGYASNFLWFLHDWGVVFRKVTIDSPRTSIKPSLFDRLDGYAMYSPYHATTLRESMMRWLELPSQTRVVGNARITILDRKHSRRIMYVETIRQALEEGLSTQHDGIRIVYFEETSFAEQISILSDTDVLVTPHGAQLVGTPFLRPCASVLEIFPFRYCLPYFYGSLASATGMDYHYMFLGNECMVETEKRGQRRSVNLCLDVNTVVQGVQELLKEWMSRECHDRID